MLVDTTLPIPQVDNSEVQEINILEMFLSQICGECTQLRPMTLNDLLILATESDLTLATILAMEYIKPLEEYCEKTQPCDIAFPKLLSLIGKTSEDELDLICRSSIPSFLLTWMDSISDKNVITEIGNCLLMMTSTPRSFSSVLAHHQTNIFAFIDHLKSSTSSIPHVKILAHLYFSPQPEVSKMALKALLTSSNRNSKAQSFLRTLKVPSGSTDSSSELVPFARRLCSTLAEHVSEMKSLFTESSPSDGTISALSATLPAESPLLSGNAVLEVLCDGLSLLDILVVNSRPFERTILIDSDYVPLLQSTIIACLDLLDQQETKHDSARTDFIDVLIRLLDRSWICAGNSLYNPLKPLPQVVQSAFSDVPQLCSLLERTCRLSSRTNFSPIFLIVNVSATLPHLIPHLLEENLVERMIDVTNPMAIPISHRNIHGRLVWAISNFMTISGRTKIPKEERKRLRKLQFECAFKPAKQYLVFILQREQFIPTYGARDKDLPSRIDHLLDQALLLERELLEDGENVETGREVWEVGWLVEKTDEGALAQKLLSIKEDDVFMKKNRRERWKNRAKRQREEGQEDAIEGWLKRKDSKTRSEIVESMKRLSEERGMNTRF
ncbi:hypothetical protein BLNAU_5874 [Blattamonas nauphoetae]|uniref:Uncharacterized protein n=1 Tax=Blattamonas nauphoetae TaxID=2049346 RepID=A0ABQ9Y5X8_9EUKA|nr:hypothetical protein BLNAU_5874 [Blattamonas nauphoetae]